MQISVSFKLLFELEQFLFDRFEILTVSIKYVGFFQYVENCSSWKAFFMIFLLERIFLKTLIFFQKLIF